MNLYDRTAYLQSRLLTNAYSTSFSSSSRLFRPAIRPHIYAIYALVRIADEIVDTYKGSDAQELLDQLEHDTYAAMNHTYSVNPIIHAFAMTAVMFTISKELLEPFFASMRMDLKPVAYTAADYDRYIHGSAEVIGLMCLKVFVDGDAKRYKQLAPAAKKLGAAYQKINFLRDIAADYTVLGRYYFPVDSYTSFSNSTKQTIVDDIRNDIALARPSLMELPPDAARAVGLSVSYYEALLQKLQSTDASDLKQKRLHVHNGHKSWLLIRSLVGGKR